MAYVPTPVSESTAIEVVRKEGDALSWNTNGTITAGDIVTVGTSGFVKAILTTPAAQCRVALYDAVSGARVTAIKGKVRCRWDGSGTLNRGVLIEQGSRSGWFTVLIAALSSGIMLGHSWDNGSAATSGLLHVVEIL